MTEPCALPEITEVKRLGLQPGDTVILEVDGHWSQRDAHRAEEYLKAKFPGHEVAIIVGGTLKVSSEMPVTHVPVAAQPVQFRGLLPFDEFRRRELGETVVSTKVDVPPRERGDDDGQAGVREPQRR